jgi:galactokinase
VTVDLADRLDLAPELRMACYSFREEFGHPPTVVWRVPGTVTLLADRGTQLTVSTPWGAIAVAVPRDDDALELVLMERPGERFELTATGAIAGEGPSWAGRGLGGARSGGSLLVSSELPAGTGVGSTAAMETAVWRCLDDCAAGRFGVHDPARAAASGPAGPYASLGNWRLPLDLAAAEIRLVVIDTRVRGTVVAPQSEYSSLDAAAGAIGAGDLEAFGALLTAAHRARPCNRGQDLAVTAALRAGALGARAITDGPGRPALALVPTDRLPAVRASVSGTFARYGLRVPRILTFTPAG